MSQQYSTKCANPRCNHPKENHVELVCTGDLLCMCSHYMEPELYAFAQEVEAQKMILKTVEKRAKFILEKIPTTRNASEKSFPKIYWEIWEGFKIRKGTPQALDTDTWKRLTKADAINRAKRKVKAENPELATYNPATIERQSQLFQAYSEWAVNA